MPTSIYHITHIGNLPGILTAGELLSTNGMAGIEHVNIAHGTIQERRARRRVPFKPGGTLHDYVPFYFAPRSPMLYSINGGYVGGYTDGQAKIVHLVASAEAIDDEGLPFVFTDGHAIMDFTEFYNDLDDLKQIDWKVMKSPYWNDTIEFPDRKRQRQAEFLVRDGFPVELIERIGVLSEAERQAVTAILAAYRVRIPVTIERGWYY